MTRMALLVVAAAAPGVTVTVTVPWQLVSPPLAASHWPRAGPGSGGARHGVAALGSDSVRVGYRVSVTSLSHWHESAGEPEPPSRSPSPSPSGYSSLSPSLQPEVSLRAQAPTRTMSPIPPRQGPGRLRLPASLEVYGRGTVNRRPGQLAAAAVSSESSPSGTSRSSIHYVTIIMPV